MISTEKFYDSIDLQLQFLEQLKYIPEEEIDGLIEVLRDFIFQPDTKQKVIYGIGEGRSALALYDFLHQLLKYEQLFPATLDDPIRRYFDPDRSNMVLSASGSGSTESVINYLEDAHHLGAKEILITAKTDSPAYIKVTSHNGFIFLIEDIKLEKPSELAVMGSEFELKLCTMLNSILPALDGNDVSLYYQQIEHYLSNARLLRKINKKYLQSWIDKLLNRRGHYIVDGVGRSGFVAKAFGMRLTHLGQHVYIKGDATTPSFVRGDVYIPVSGSGNTREILEGMKKARNKGVDVFPITVNKSSRMVELMEKWGYEDNIIFIPVEKGDMTIFHDLTPNKITTTKMNQMRPSISEINSYIFTNAIIASAIDFLGVDEKYMKRIHW
ncbi:MAG TPA: SIS domain-containing protein [Thermodesulfobacteriaceae bacterium]|nr:SIS domain-containing protein [Thermodesulfobacteriaceae bacterium]